MKRGELLTKRTTDQKKKKERERGNPKDKEDDKNSNVIE